MQEQQGFRICGHNSEAYSEVGTLLPDNINCCISVESVGI